MSSSFNSSAVRQGLIGLPQYAAGPGFIAGSQWRMDSHRILSVAAPPDAPIEPVPVIVVGFVSREKAYLGTHGTFNPKFADPARNARTAKLQFSLECPSSHPVLAADFQVAYRNLATVQGQAALTPRMNHLLVHGAIRLNYNLMEEKNADNCGPMRNAITNNYRVGSEYKQWWDPLKETHQIRRMPVYDVDENLNEMPETWERKLLGALVEVTFSIHHFHMGATTARPEASDVFSARIATVSILAPPATLLRSPYQEVASPRKPRHIPSLPTTPSTPSTPPRNHASLAAPSTPSTPTRTRGSFQGSITQPSFYFGMPGASNYSIPIAPPPGFETETVAATQTVEAETIAADAAAATEGTVTPTNGAGSSGTSEALTPTPTDGSSADATLDSSAAVGRPKRKHVAPRAGTITIKAKAGSVKGKEKEVVDADAEVVEEEGGHETVNEENKEDIPPNKKPKHT